MISSKVQAGKERYRKYKIYWCEKCEARKTWIVLSFIDGFFSHSSSISGRLIITAGGMQALHATGLMNNYSTPPGRKADIINMSFGSTAQHGHWPGGSGIYRDSGSVGPGGLKTQVDLNIEGLKSGLSVIPFERIS